MSIHFCNFSLIYACAQKMYANKSPSALINITFHKNVQRYFYN